MHSFSPRNYLHAQLIADSCCCNKYLLNCIWSYSLRNILNGPLNSTIVDPSEHVLSFHLYMASLTRRPVICTKDNWQNIVSYPILIRFLESTQQCEVLFMNLLYLLYWKSCPIGAVHVEGTGLTFGLFMNGHFCTFHWQCVINHRLKLDTINFNMFQFVKSNIKELNYVLHELKGKQKLFLQHDLVRLI
jgi:hypothetical protein